MARTRTDKPHFDDPTAEAVRMIVARGIAQRLPADSIVRHLAAEGLVRGVGRDEVLTMSSELYPPR